MVTLDELVFDPANPDDGANVGATLRGADGTVIGNTSDALKVDIASSSGTLDVSGSEVSLDAATLAALENITVTVDNSEVEISNDTGNPIPVSDAGGSITVDATDLDIRDLAFATDKVDVTGSEVQQDSYDSMQTSAQTVTNTASELAATPLAGRKKMLIQNLGNKDIWIGPSSGVTDANGIKIPRGASAEFDFSETRDVFAITSSGSADVRLMEMAY